ncbi:MAG TPA: M48 family metalloprotease [Armatimonadaceae bacterium]|nr:M48 family metalloprotease [Armatimonadaceae bacterium]
MNLLHLGCMPYSRTPEPYRRRGTLTATVLLSAALSTALLLPTSPASAQEKKDAGKPAAAAKPAKPPAEDPEVKMGREAHEDLLKSGIKLIRDPKLVERVETIGKKIASVANANPLPATYGSSKHVPFDYKFFVVDDPDVNAFCLPGGYIYVNKGLLDYVQSDDELAGVLGHEVTHAAHHHIVKLQKEQSRLNTQLAIGLLAAILARVPTTDTMNLLTGFQLIAIQKVNGYGQDAERDSDRTGVTLTHKAGYNPVGALTFMERLGRDQKTRPDIEMGIFRTHPPEKERADAMVAQIKEMGLPINRREVTNALRVQVRSVSATKEAAAPATPPATAAVGSVSEVLLEGKVIYRTSSQDRAKQAAAALDKVLDSDLQIYDISRRGATLLARGEPILTIETEEASLLASSSPSVAAENAYKALRSALYRHLLNGAY